MCTDVCACVYVCSFVGTDLLYRCQRSKQTVVVTVCVCVCRFQGGPDEVKVT